MGLGLQRRAVRFLGQHHGHAEPAPARDLRRCELHPQVLMASDRAVPRYLAQTYWWAYVHPNAVRLFERQWLVNLILWGNFAALRDAALAALGERLDGRTLQIACVYGDLTSRLRARLSTGGSL